MIFSHRIPLMSRTLFIGDVHGCYDELIELVAKVWLTSEDHLYFVGDLINKWPKSLEVVEWIRARPNTWSVIGNHEYYTFREEYSDFGQGNLSWIDKHYESTAPLREMLSSHREWLMSLPHIIEREDFILVHGGLHPDHGIETPVELATLTRLINGKPWYESYHGDKLVIYGHFAVDSLRIRPNTIGLDTGCCFGGHLTAYCLETREIWQVHAQYVYKVPADWKGKIQV